MYEWIIAVAVVLLSLYHWFHRRTYFQKNGIIHKRPLPFIGNSAPIVFKTASMAEYIQSTYNLNTDAKYVGFHDFTDRIVMIRDPDLLKTVAIRSFDHFVNHRLLLSADQEPLFAKNLLSLQGNQWREVRHLLSPAFTSSKMKAMFILMSDCAKNFAAYLTENAKKEATINSKDVFLKYTSDVIATCAFGVTVDSMRNPTNDFYVLGKKATSFSGYKLLLKFCLIRVFPGLARWLGIRFSDSKVEAFFTQLVKDTIEMRDREGVTRPDMLQLMMDTRNNKPGEGPRLSIQDMVSEAFIFFFGGFDSTASAMCFITHSIAAHPDVQRKLQEEVDVVKERCRDGLTYEAVNGMEYLEAVIHEGLRMYPNQIATDRVCCEEFELPPALPGKQPVPLKPGDMLFLPIYALQRDPKFFPNPDEFRPERFIEDPQGTLHSPAYLPFGVGPRMCIGNRFALLEIKVLLFHLISRCKLMPGENMILPLELSTKTLAMHAKGDFWLTLEPRCGALGDG